MSEPQIETVSETVVPMAGWRGSRSPSPPLSGGGGGGTFDPMEARVKALETGMDKVLGKLDEIGKSIADGRLENEKRFSTLEVRLTAIEGKLDTKASAETLSRIGGEIGARLVGLEKDLAAKATMVEVGVLKGAVDKLPTTWQIVGPMAGLIFATLAGVGGLAFVLAKYVVPGQ